MADFVAFFVFKATTRLKPTKFQPTGAIEPPKYVADGITDMPSTVYTLVSVHLPGWQ